MKLKQFCGPVKLAGVEMPYLTVQDLELDLVPSRPAVSFADEWPRIPPPDQGGTCLTIGDGENVKVWRNEWKFNPDSLVPDDIPDGFPVDLLNWPCL